MINKIFLLAALAVSVFSAQLPINSKYEISIENGEFTVFEFPFDIKKTFKSGFLLQKSAKEIQDMKDDENQIIIDPRTNKQTTHKNEIIQIKQGKRSMTFLPKARGSFKLVIWGFKYPIMFNIKVVDTKDKKSEMEIEYYYKFLDYSTNTKKATKFETDPHEKVIVKLIRATYNKKLPSGYKSSRSASEFADNFFNYTLNFSYTGKKYTSEEWLIENTTDQKIVLYEEQFTKDNVFGVAFENNIVEAGKTTRMYIVRKSSKGDY